MEIINFAGGNGSQAAVNSRRQILGQSHNFVPLFNSQMTVDSSISHLIFICDLKVFSINPSGISMRTLLNIQSLLLWVVCFFYNFHNPLKQQALSILQPLLLWLLFQGVIVNLHLISSCRLNGRKLG